MDVVVKSIVSMVVNCNRSYRTYCGKIMKGC